MTWPLSSSAKSRDKRPNGEINRISVVLEIDVNYVSRFFFQENSTIREEVEVAKLPHLDPSDVIGCHDNYQVNWLMQWDSFMYDMANDVITLTLKEDKKSSDIAPVSQVSDLPKLELLPPTK